MNLEWFDFGFRGVFLVWFLLLLLVVLFNWGTLVYVHTGTRRKFNSMWMNSLLLTTEFKNRACKEMTRWTVSRLLRLAMICSSFIIIKVAAVQAALHISYFACWKELWINKYLLFLWQDRLFKGERKCFQFVLMVIFLLCCPHNSLW